MASQVRQNYHEDCEAALNKHINTELCASYTFLSLSYYFERDDIALPGLCKYFKAQSDTEYQNAHKLMEYQNKRGGRIVLQTIAAPAQQEWGQAGDALHTALELKKQVNKELLELHDITSEKNDSHATHYLDDTFLNPHVDTIQQLGEMVTQLKRVGGKELGLHVFDKHLL